MHMSAVDCTRRRHVRASVPAVARRNVVGGLALLLTWPAGHPASAESPAELPARSPVANATAEPLQAGAIAGTAADLQERVTSNASAGPSGRDGIVFTTNDFSMVVPADFIDKQPPPPPTSGFGAPVRSTLGQPKESPLKARFESADGRESVSVIMRASADIKPTFLQITDISQFGTPQQVAQLVLPRDVRLLSTAVSTTQPPPKDTGTVIGVVERDPITTYRYEFLTRNQHVVMAVSSKLGKVFMAAGATDEATFPSAAQQLKAAVDSFQLIV